MSRRRRRCPAPVTTGAPLVVGVGMCTVDLLFAVPRQPEFGRGMLATEYVRQGGGPVATALVALARLGIPTRLIGSVGDDDDGVFIRAGLEAEGVDASGLRVAAGALSRVALVLVDSNSGERGFAGRPATCPPLTPEDLPRQAFAAAEVVHLDDATPAAVQAARWAHEDGITVVFDGTWMSPHLDDLLPLVDFPIVSEPFARSWMPGAPPETVLERLWRYGPQAAILTLGARGCAVRTEDGAWLLPAWKTRVADTTGAGDAFHGGFIFGLLRGWSIQHATRFAAAVAALNCRLLGGRTALPRRTEVERFMDRETAPVREPLR